MTTNLPNNNPSAAAPVPACAGASGTPGAAGGLDLIRKLKKQLARVTKERNELRALGEDLYHKLASFRFKQAQAERQSNANLVKARRRRPAVKVISSSDISSNTRFHSLCRGKIVWWDEDFDERVIGFLDAMPANILDRLYEVYEHEGCINLVWDGTVPEGYKEGSQAREPEGDYWTINSSVGLLEDRILPFEKVAL